MPPFIVETRDETAKCHNSEMEPDGKQWFHDMQVFVANGSHPESANSTNKRTLRKLVCRFFLNVRLFTKGHMMGYY